MGEDGSLGRTGHHGPRPTHPPQGLGSCRRNQSRTCWVRFQFCSMAASQITIPLGTGTVSFRAICPPPGPVQSQNGLLIPTRPDLLPRGPGLRIVGAAVKGKWRRTHEAQWAAATLGVGGDRAWGCRVLIPRASAGTRPSSTWARCPASARPPLSTSPKGDCGGRKRLMCVNLVMLT